MKMGAGTFGFAFVLLAAGLATAEPPADVLPGPEQPAPYAGISGLRSADVLFSFNRGVLLQQRWEIVRKRRPTSLHFFEVGAGFYGTAGSKVTVQYSDGTERKGDFKVAAFPIFLGLSRYREEGFFAGKWGLGVSPYFYNGSVELHDGSLPYRGRGLGANLVVPFEGLLTGRTGRTSLRLKGAYHIPLTQAKFENPYGRLTGVTPFGGFFLGLSVAQIF